MAELAWPSICHTGRVSALSYLDVALVDSHRATRRLVSVPDSRGHRVPVRGRMITPHHHRYHRALSPNS